MDTRVTPAFGLAALAAGAAAIHFAMVPAHAGEWLPLAVAFALTAWAQVALAVGLVARPAARGLVGGGLALTLVALWAWLLSRTLGFPVGPGAGHPEAVGTVDLVCAATEALLAVGLTLRLVRPRAGAATSVPPRRLGAAVVALAAIAATSVALSMPSTAHEHAHGDEAAEPAPGDDGHDHGTAEASAAAAEGADHDHAAACTEPVTADQQAAADRLVVDSEAGSARYTDVAAAEAAGYRPITDPEKTLVHYANAALMTDGAVVDPEQPESLLYAFSRAGAAFLVGVMYLNDDAAADPPQPGGCLTVWHDHPDLCLTPDGIVSGPGTDGTCDAGSADHATTDMLHVWFMDVPSGPFSELADLDPATVRDSVIAYLSEAA